MASSIMHLAVINELAKRFQFKDQNRQYVKALH